MEWETITQRKMREQVVLYTDNDIVEHFRRRGAEHWRNAQDVTKSSEYRNISLDIASDFAEMADLLSRIESKERELGEL